MCERVCVSTCICVCTCTHLLEGCPWDSGNDFFASLKGVILCPKDIPASSAAWFQLLALMPDHQAVGISLLSEVY